MSGLRRRADAAPPVTVTGIRDAAPVVRLIHFFLPRAARANRARAWAEILVHIADDDGIRAANLSVFGRDYVTDVISLAYPPLPGEGAGWTGEIVVNLQRARESAIPRSPPPRELALYLAHGCDHLHGASDSTPRRRARMLARESRWVLAAATSGLLGPRFRGILDDSGRARSGKGIA